MNFCKISYKMFKLIPQLEFNSDVVFRQPGKLENNHKIKKISINLLNSSILIC